MREESFLGGPLEPTNRAYAVAKIAGSKCVGPTYRQYGTRFLAAMPTNLYGPGDQYHPQNSHLLPALIRKMHEAKITDCREVVIWEADSRREFLHSEDVADACIFLLGLPPQAFVRLAGHGDNDVAPLVNIGSGEDMTVRALADLVAEVVGVSPSLVFDSSKPDGTARKLLDTSRLAALGWKPRIGLRDGLRQTYEDFCSRFNELQPNGLGPAGAKPAPPVTECAS